MFGPVARNSDAVGSQQRFGVSFETSARIGSLKEQAAYGVRFLRATFVSIIEGNVGFVDILTTPVPQGKLCFLDVLRVQKAKNQSRQRKERENPGDVTLCSQIRL